jgi:two-component system response regulator PhoP
VTLDTARQELTVEGKVIELTGFEYRIIEHLMMRAGEVISKSELTDRLYDQDFERDSNVIEVFIGRLRKKMDPGNRIKPIETLRGRGYRFALERNHSGQ